MARTVRPAAGAQAWPGPGSRQASPLRAPSLQARHRARRWSPATRTESPWETAAQTAAHSPLSPPPGPPLHLAFPRENSQPGCLRPAARHVTVGHQPHVTTLSLSALLHSGHAH